MKLDPRTSTDQLHSDLKIPKVSDMTEINTLAFVRKCLLEDCPPLFYKYFIFQGHRYDVRVSKLTLPDYRLELAKKATKYKGAILWNSLDASIKSKYKYKSFRKVLKNYYISKY